MNQPDIYTARLADNAAVPTLTCGHCNSMISKTRVFINKAKADAKGRVLAYCSADDCDAINSCDEALERLDESMAQQTVAG